MPGGKSGLAAGIALQRPVSCLVVLVFWFRVFVQFLARKAAGVAIEAPKPSPMRLVAGMRAGVLVVDFEQHFAQRADFTLCAVKQNAHRRVSAKPQCLILTSLSSLVSDKERWWGALQTGRTISPMASAHRRKPHFVPSDHRLCNTGARQVSFAPTQAIPSRAGISWF